MAPPRLKVPELRTSLAVAETTSCCDDETRNMLTNTVDAYRAGGVPADQTNTEAVTVPHEQTPQSAQSYPYFPLATASASSTHVAESIPDKGQTHDNHSGRRKSLEHRPSSEWQSFMMREMQRIVQRLECVESKLHRFEQTDTRIEAVWLQAQQQLHDVSCAFSTAIQLEREARLVQFEAFLEQADRCRCDYLCHDAVLQRQSATQNSEEQPFGSVDSHDPKAGDVPIGLMPFHSNDSSCADASLGECAPALSAKVQTVASDGVHGLQDTLLPESSLKSPLSCLREEVIRLRADLLHTHANLRNVATTSWLQLDSS